MKIMWKLKGLVLGLLLPVAGWCMCDEATFECLLGPEGVATAEVMVERPLRVPVLTVRMYLSEYDKSDLKDGSVIGELNVSGLMDGEVCFSGEKWTSERELTLGGAGFFFLQSAQRDLFAAPGYDERNCFGADENRFLIVSMVSSPEGVPPGEYQIIIKARNRII